jgi:uncharacterized DUF497 family protein
VQFEWDDAKAARNLARHGISFGEALEVFSDPLSVEFEDDRYDYDERRFVPIGMVGTKLLSVVFTERKTFHGEAVRIISAREAGPHEQRTYRAGNARGS